MCHTHEPVHKCSWLKQAGWTGLISQVYFFLMFCHLRYFFHSSRTQTVDAKIILPVGSEIQTCFFDQYVAIIMFVIIDVLYVVLRWFSGDLYPVLPGLSCWCLSSQQRLSSSAGSVSATSSNPFQVSQICWGRLLWFTAVVRCGMNTARCHCPCRMSARLHKCAWNPRSTHDMWNDRRVWTPQLQILYRWEARGWS